MKKKKNCSRCLECVINMRISEVPIAFSAFHYFTRDLNKLILDLTFLMISSLFVYVIWYQLSAFLFSLKMVPNITRSINKCCGYRQSSNTTSRNVAIPEINYGKTGKKLRVQRVNRKHFEFSKNFKSLQFLMVQGSLNPNITILGEKLWPVAWNQKFTSVI